MNAHVLRRKIRHQAEFANMSMASESMSDSAQPMDPTVIFDENDDAVDIHIQSGVTIVGHVDWRTGEKTPFEAKVEGGEPMVRFGQWELPK